jgi:hypothetical protein
MKREDLVDRLDNYTEGYGWFDFESSDDIRLVVCVGSSGTELEYPFSVDEFWSTVDDLEERKAED